MKYLVGKDKKWDSVVVVRIPSRRHKGTIKKNMISHGIRDIFTTTNSQGFLLDSKTAHVFEVNKRDGKFVHLFVDGEGEIYENNFASCCYYEGIDIYDN